MHYTPTSLGCVDAECGVQAVVGGQVEAAWGDAGQGPKESARGLLTESWGGPAAGPGRGGGT